MGYSTYLFDFDYTLVDSSKGILTCFRNVLTKHGYTDVTDDQIKQTIGRTLEESFSILTSITEKDQLELFRKEYTKEADIYMTSNTVFFIETKSVLNALKDAGAIIGIISTKYRYRIKELLDQHLPENFFNIIIGGEDVSTAKPSPEGILLAMKHLNVSKEEILYIGDSIVDAKAAEAANVDFAGVLHGVTTAEELSQYSHVKIMKTLEGLLQVEEPITSIQTTPIQKKHSNEKERAKPHQPKLWKRVLFLTTLAITGVLAIAELLVAESCFFAIIFSLIVVLYFRRRGIPVRIRKSFPKWTSRFETYTRLFHLKQISGHIPSPLLNNSTICLNCNNTYTGNYCNRCGQSKKTARLSFTHGVKNIFGGLSHMEHGFWGTLFELLYRPGYMIGDFIRGKRAHHLGPFHALFLLAALYILLVKFVDPNALKQEEEQQPKVIKTEQLDVVREQLQQELSTINNEQKKEAIIQLQKYLNKDSLNNMQDKQGLVAKKTRHRTGFIAELSKAHGEIYSYIQQKLSNSPFLQKVWDLLHHWAHGNKAASIILTLPVFAFATRMAFRKRTYMTGLNTTEHLFIQAYIAAQILLISCLYFPFNGKAQINELYDVPNWIIFLLFWWDYKQLFRGTWTKSFLRTLLMFLYSLLIIIVLAIIVITLIISGIYLIKAIGS